MSAEFRHPQSVPSRREVLARAALAAAGLPLLAHGSLAGGARASFSAEQSEAPGGAAGPAVPQPAQGGPPPTRGARDRLVVSTWWFGQAANAAAFAELQRGRDPLDAVEAGARVAEADPAVDSVGYGGRPNAEGVVELDACVMRGDTLECGAVAALTGILHPVSVARRVMERTPHVLLAGAGALAFARAQGFPEQELLTPAARAAWEQWRAGRGEHAEPWERALPSGSAPQADTREDGNHDTIGLIALQHGRLATAVSTSGLAFKLPGRVGDSPIVGAGSFCDDRAGAAVATGVGEEALRVAGCSAVVEGLRRGLTPRRAGLEVLRRVLDVQGRRGRRNGLAFLVLSRSGEVWGGAVVDGFHYAITDADGTRLVQGEAVT